MTHLIIHSQITDRNAYLLRFLNEHLNKQFTEIIQLRNIADIHIIENLPTESIGIEEVKKLQKEMIFHPLELPYQAGIIFHSQTLTPEAQNALLKTLEEQPDTTLYILMVDNEKNLLDTIVSRCVKHYVVKEKAQNEEKSLSEGVIEKPEILTKDMVSQFEDIAIAVDGENNEVAQLIESLLTYYKGKLETAIIAKDNENMQKASEAIKKIYTAQTRIKANTNKKMTLENMILQISYNHDM